MQEYRMFGPPGTGKTTRLATQVIPNAVKTYGYDKVMITSFTRTAAQEIASRGIEVDSDMVGTLHSICFRALNNPKLHVTCLKDWNEKYPHYSIVGNKTGSVDEGGDSQSLSSDSEGDELYSNLQILRAKMIPMEDWTAAVKNFHQLWTAWKDDMGCMDFTDLIEQARKTIPMAPGNPQVMIVDEAQDFNKQQISLVRSWGLHMRWHLLVGDDEQCIFGFSGADPETFLNPPLEDKFKTVLDQSYRVPAAVHKKALEISAKISIKEEKVYHPKKDRDTGDVVEGRVAYGEGHYKDPAWALKKADNVIAGGGNVMFLTTCSYMLGSIIADLRDRGIPFHNPYRKARGDWNPLGREADGVSAAQLLTAFFGHGEDENYWTVEQMITWAQYIKVGEKGLVRKKGKKAIKALEEAVMTGQKGIHTCRNVLAAILMPDAIEAALNRDVEWLKENIQKARIQGLAYPLKIYNKFGYDALNKKPQIIVGTIHSVKGGEANTVFIYPDISYAAAREREEGQEGRDSLARLFYVGVTRAEETLYIMEPAVSGNKGYSSTFVEL